MDLMDYRRKIIANSPHLMSVEGDIVSFSDGADLPLKSLLVDIEPVQSGTGDPSPSNMRPISGWDSVHLTRCGKNLFSTFEEGDITNSGITFDFSDSDVVKISGTSTATNASSQNKIIGGTNTPTPIEFRQGNTYTISLQGTVSISKANDFRIFLRSNSNANLWYGDSTNGVWTFTPESTFVAERIMLRIKSNGTTVSVDAHLQIELGSTATPYEPYNGVNVSIDLGQTVYGGTLNPLTGVLTAYPYYASYNGETLTGEWISDRDKYVSGTTPTIGAQVVDMSGTGTEIQLTPHQIRTLYGNNTIFADTGNVALEYWAHP